VEEAAAAQSGFDWLPVAMMVASALAAGALLRAWARVFLGAGPPGTADESSDEGREEAEPEEDLPQDRTPAVLWGPAVALLAAGLAWGIVPGLAQAAHEAAARFISFNLYAAEVLNGVRGPAPHLPHVPGPELSSYLYGAGATVGAIAVAAAGVRRVGTARLHPAFAGVRALHSGHVGDYVAWLTAGVAVIGVVFGVTLR
jgi:multicomponent Na+:H+ antiporter subunit D